MKKTGGQKSHATVPLNGLFHEILGLNSFRLKTTNSWFAIIFEFVANPVVRSEKREDFLSSSQRSFRAWMVKPLVVDLCNCAGPYGPGSRCLPNGCIFGCEKPQGVGILEWGVYEQGREMESLVYEQPGNEVDGSCHNTEGSK